MAADAETDAEARTRDAVEVGIRALCEEGDYDLGATRAIDAYGREIRSFLEGRLRGGADARRAFAMFSEDLWRGMPGFAWRCTLRAWAYGLARHAEVRFGAAAQPRPERARTLSLRARLDEEDQLILVLRVDRGLAWAEIAQVLAAPSGPRAACDPGQLQQEEARISRRFAIIKTRLRSWAGDRAATP